MPFIISLIIITIALFLSKNIVHSEEYLYLIAILCEIIILFIICNKIKNKIISTAISLLTLIIYSTQSFALYKYNDYITTLALQNLNYINLVFSSSMIPYILVYSILVFILVYIQYKSKYISIKKEIIIVSTSICIIGFTLWSNSGLTFTPVVSICKNTFNVFHQETINSDGYNFNKKPSFKHKLKYRSTVKNPNIIVFFFEGLSKRSITEFNDKYKNLTNNINNFKNISCEIENYYNHTAATYRGIQGTLTSCYPLYGGAAGWFTRALEFKEKGKNFYSSVPKILATKGYDTYFIDPHFNSDPLQHLLEMLGFNTIYCAGHSPNDSLGTYPKMSRENAIHDKNNFNVLKKLLEKKATRNDTKPFFIGFYNMETHAFVDTEVDGIKYGNGKNISLNSIHNLDIWFGDFFEWFKKTNFSNNTMIILTSDHSHYPEPPFCEAAGSDLQRMFCDEIPFYIYAPFMDLPKSYTGNGVFSSLDFAPTILHLLDINVKTTFMGTSIFENENEIAIHWHSPWILIERNNKYYEKNIPEKYKDFFTEWKKKILIFHDLERKQIESTSNK